MEFDVVRRMRAARHLAGYRSVDALAEAMDQRGFSTKTLRGVEQGHRTPTPSELNEIAHTCGVPLAWFTADFSRLAEISDDPRRVIAGQLAAARGRSRARLEGTSEDTPSQAEEGR